MIRTDIIVVLYRLSDRNSPAFYFYFRLVFASSLALTSLSSSSTMSLEPIVPETRVLAIASHVGTPLHNHSSGAYG